MTCDCPELNCQCDSRIIRSDGLACTYCQLGLHLRYGDDPKPWVTVAILNEDKPNGRALKIPPKQKTDKPIVRKRRNG